MGQVVNIEDAEVIEVGRFYMVPTVIMPHRPKALRMVPVIGPLHEDAKFIKFADHHWHPDRRFVTERWLNEEGPNHWATVMSPYPTPRHLKWLSKIEGRPVYTQAVTEPEVIDGGRRKLKCRRLIGSFCNPRTGTPPAWLHDLERAYAREMLREGHICPHRGISCRGVIAESDGVVCPGHGLKWNTETGRLVSRVGQSLDEQIPLRFAV